MLLVFAPSSRILLIMDKSWHAKIISFLQKPAKVVAAPADDTNAEVQFNQGLRCAGATGAAPDYAQAAVWYRKAAAQSHALAHFNLGMMYARGQGVKADVAESWVWLGKAAQLGDAGGQFSVGERCHRASFKQTPADAVESRIEAYKWYRLAAAQGYKQSENAYTTLTHNMSRADVTTAIERVAAFETLKPATSAGPVAEPETVTGTSQNSGV